MKNEKICLRKISTSKLEHVNPEIYEWWLHIFDVLEQDIHMPTEICRPFLKEHLPRYLFKELEKDYELINQKFSDVPKEKPIVHSDTKTVLSETEKSILDSCEMVVNDVSSFQKQLGLIPSVKSNPYVNFFQRRLDRAAIWKELPPLAVSDMNLNQLTELLAKNIATEFVTWFSSLGGQSSTSVTVQNIIEMFEIGSQVSCATSLKVELAELPCIPDEVAKVQGVTDKSKRKMLFGEILKDQKASKQKPRLIAFGKSLPKEMKIKPPPQNTFEKWLQCKTIPENLESMAAVWQGITHLRSTRKFCDYIYSNHPNLKPPKYLLENGMMYSSREVISQKSIQQGSFGNVSRFSFDLK